MTRTRTASLLRSALFAALISASAFIVVPIGPVPVTLQVLMVALAMLLLTPAEAFLALALYVALGAIGLPVFSGGGAGVGVIAGPTGGFILGFVPGAVLGAALRRLLTRGRAGARVDGRVGLVRETVADAVSLAALLAVIYLAGWAQFGAVTGKAAAEALRLAVAPFVLVDAGKCAVAILVARGVRAAGFGDR